MAKAMEFLRRLTARTEVTEQPETMFDLRLQKMGGVRPDSVSRAVLFRTQAAQQEA